jgi:hypothetical protein
MAQSIPPQHAIDEVVLETLEVQYKPKWDGTNWVITPADVDLVCEAHVGSGGNEVDKVTHIFKATDLPAAGKTALTALYNHLETSIAAKY